MKNYKISNKNIFIITIIYLIIVNILYFNIINYIGYTVYNLSILIIIDVIIPIYGVLYLTSKTIKRK